MIFSGLILSYTRTLDLIKMQKEVLCFIEAVAIQRKYPAIIMSNSEYYQEYVAKFVGPKKPFKINYLRKGKQT